MNKNKNYNILYVDDEISNLNVFKNTFRRDYNIFTAESAKEGLEILEQGKIDLIITDQRMPEMSGVEFLKKVMLNYPEPSRILITGFTDFTALKEAINDAKIFQYIQKPWDKEEVHRVIDNALELQYLRIENNQLAEDLRISNEQLSGLNKELLELDKLKLQFLRIISHSIRTPLNGLVCSTALFKNAMVEEEFQKYEQLFHILESSTQKLERFLLLAEQITVFQANKHKVNPELVSLNELITETAKTLQDKLEKKNLKLEFDLSNDKDSCFADKLLIKICLTEIIDNAIKYSNANEKIIIKSSIRDNNAVIELIDNGPGFPEIVLKNIYKPFITDMDVTNDAMGLALVFIKLIIEAHNGTINISNNENGGSTVQLNFNKHS